MVPLNTARLDVTEFLFELDYKTENLLILISQRYIENVYLYKVCLMWLIYSSFTII